MSFENNLITKKEVIETGLRAFKKSTEERIRDKDKLIKLREDYVIFVKERKEKIRECLEEYRKDKTNSLKIDIIILSNIIKECNAKIKLIDNQLCILELEQKNEEIIKDCIKSIIN